MLLFLADSAYSPVHCVCLRAEVWGMFGRCWREKMLGSHLRGWCSLPWAVQHHRCQTPGPSLLLLEPADQTLGTGLSKPISSWREEQTERLWYSLLARNGDKKHFALTLRTNVFTQQILVSYLHLSMFMNVSYLLTIHEQHRALREARYRTTHPYMHTALVLYMFSCNQRAKTWKCGDTEWKQSIVIQERINRKQHGLGHRAVSQKD